jgi:hypothetical protein
MRRTNSKTKSERGQVLIIGALVTTALIGSIGLIYDTGHHMSQRRHAQTAADAAAMAAAYRVAAGATTGEAQTAALHYAAQNGFDNDGTSNTVTIHRPPTSGDHSGNANYVEVIIDEDPETFFIHAITPSGSGVRARAVAGSTTSGTGSYAVLVLDETTCRSFEKTGSSNFTITNGGGLMVNSNCDPGIRQTGSGNMSAGVIHYYQPGGWSKVGSGSISPTPASVSARISDPLSSLAQPVPGVTVGTSLDSGGTAAAPALKQITGSSNVTLRPGTYWGGLRISGSGNVTFQPGLYIFAGGGFTQTGSGNLSGTGVTFYNTNDPTNPTGAGAYDSFDLAGSGNNTFSAPTSGPYANMIWWQDRNNTSTFDKTGSGNLGSGIIYVPNAHMDLNGSGNVGAVQIIVKTFRATGSGNQTIPYTGYVSMGQPSVALVE